MPSNSLKNLRSLVFHNSEGKGTFFALSFHFDENSAVLLFVFTKAHDDLSFTYFSFPDSHSCKFSQLTRYWEGVSHHTLIGRTPVLGFELQRC